MEERERRKERIFWSLASEKDDITLVDGDNGKSKNPLFAGMDCAYGNPRDKPSGKRRLGFCPSSRAQPEKY